jgi:acyl-CoA synthetase (AMP-forming)/AMP-acid ligase II
MIKYNYRKIRLISIKGEITLFEAVERSALPNFISEKLSNRKKLVFLEGKNTESFCVLFAFFLKEGIPFLILPPNLHKNSINGLITDYSPSLVITGIETELHSEEQCILSDVKISCYKSKDNFIHTELALMILTSGSTRSPQACKLSFSNIKSSSEMIATTLDMIATDVGVTTLPPSYIFGLSLIFSHFSVGGSIFLQNEPIFTRKFWENLKQIKNANFGAVPTQYTMLHKIYGDKLDLSGMRYLTQAGGGMSLELRNYINDKCLKGLCDFYVMYGQTEASPRICVNKVTNQPSKKSSVGRVVPGGKISLRNKDENGIGELCYEGPNVFIGYATGYKDLSSYDPPEILNTGDLATIDEDGYVEIVGRKKRITKINGIRVNLDSIELLLRGKYGNCAVISDKDDQLTIFFVEDQSETKKIEISRLIGLHVRNIKFVKLSDLPVMENQKINYKMLIGMINE